MRILSPRRNKLIGVVGVLVVLLSPLTVAEQQTNGRLQFIGVNLNDSDTMAADSLLVKYLHDKTGFDIGEESQERGRMIRKLVAWKSNETPYLARVTPYVYVAAKMLGADFDILATYKNESGGTTYKSYFVVNKDNFRSKKESKSKDESKSKVPNAFKEEDESKPPSRDEIMQFLNDRSKNSKPAKFIYHDKFSTSSYFLPSLEFRKKHIFSTDTSISTNSENVTVIKSVNVNPNGDNNFSSDELVKSVANNDADLAAVWEGTKKKFEPETKKPEYLPLGKKVYFVEIPTILPNDLLVCPSRLNPLDKEKLREAIKNMGDRQINKGDFITWRRIGDEEVAQNALSTLEHSAEQRPAKLIVRVEKSKDSQVEESVLDTIRRAVRLSGSDLEPYDKAIHKREDMTWKIEPTHDGGINITSSILNSDLDPQRFEISSTDSPYLTKRVGDFIQSRMNRISYIWPYDDNSPTVIVDADFPISANTKVKVMRVTWNDPQKNDFSEREPFDARIVNPTPFSFQLDSPGFQKTGDSLNFDPMSNISYRVILVRPNNERPIFTIATYVFVGLLVLAAGGAVFDMRRRARKPKGEPRLTKESFNQRCRKLADNYRGFWRDRHLVEADVLWCDRSSLEELISDLKAIGLDPEFDIVRRKTRGWSFLANIPVLGKIFGLSLDGSVRVEQVMDSAKVSHYIRLGKTINFLVRADALSPFTGDKLEWDALNQLAYETFQPVSDEASHAGSNGDELFRTEHPILLSLIAKHFYGVIQEGKEKTCFFNKKWEVTQDKEEKVLAYTAVLPSTLQLNGGNTMVQRMTLRAEVPHGAELCGSLQCTEVNAWLLGKINRVEFSKNGDQTLVLNFRPTALVKIDDSE